MLHPDTVLADAVPLSWVAATDLTSGLPTWAPLELCLLDFTVAERPHLPLFQPTSNGLASGNSVVEALLHGLCEVVERDATSRSDDLPSTGRRWVDPATVTAPLVQQTLGRLAGLGIATWIVDTSGPVGLASFEAVLHDVEAGRLYAGTACHPIPAIALLRAILEAVQSRLTLISGGRDDIRRSEYGALHAFHRRRPQDVQTASFADAPSLPFDEPLACLRDVVEWVRAFTGMSPLAVDLQRSELGVPVVFVLAPGLRVGAE
jgi:ribosomal protein S12 methylthiotransferase accessory factor